MKRIYLVALAFSVFIRPMPLLGQQGPDGPIGRAENQEAVRTSARCGTGVVIAFADDPEKKGECRCPPMLGAVVSGCGAQNEVDCGQKTCHYKVFDAQFGTVSDEGDIDCEWHPYGVQ